MKKMISDVASGKSKSQLAARQKKADAVEAGLQARTTRAVKAITIGSAALGVIALGFFAAGKFKKKKRGLFS